MFYLVFGELNLAMSGITNARNSVILGFAIKRYKVLLLAAVVILIVTAVSTYLFVDRIPEKELARNCILTSQDVRSVFGKVLSVEDVHGPAKVTYSVRGEVRGYHSFDVKGERHTGDVRVRWRSRGDGSDFAVESVELIEGGTEPTVIWSSD